MTKKKMPPKKDLPRVHKELSGFDIEINSFGEINTTFSIDKINEFLNKNVDDKKLRHRSDSKEESNDLEKEVQGE